MYGSNYSLVGAALGSFLLRLALAVVVFPHGCQLMLGLFGGGGFSSSMSYFTEIEGLPAIVGFAVIFLQFFGSGLIFFGLFTRVIAFGMAGLFVGMILTSHLQHGFFMNWFGTQQGEGYEYHLLVIGMALSLAATGGGALALDKLFLRKFPSSLLNA